MDSSRCNSNAAFTGKPPLTLLYLICLSYLHSQRLFRFCVFQHRLTQSRCPHTPLLRTIDFPSRLWILHPILSKNLCTLSVEGFRSQVPNLISLLMRQLKGREGNDCVEADNLSPVHRSPDCYSRILSTLPISFPHLCFPSATNLRRLKLIFGRRKRKKPVHFKSLN